MRQIAKFVVLYSLAVSCQGASTSAMSADSSVVDTPLGGSHPEPPPEGNVSVSPPDLRTGLPPDHVLSVGILSQHRIDDSQFVALGATISLHRMADLARVETRMDLTNQSPRLNGGFRVTPTRPLEDGWYVLRVGPIPPNADPSFPPLRYSITMANNIGPDGVLRVRFRIGHQSVLALYRYCEYRGMHILSAGFTEQMQPATSRPIEVLADDSSVLCPDRSTVSPQTDPIAVLCTSSPLRQTLRVRLLETPQVAYRTSGPTVASLDTFRITPEDWVRVDTNCYWRFLPVTNERLLAAPTTTP